jgi:hypothetical protein
MKVQENIENLNIFPHWRYAVEAYKTYLKKRLIELLSSLPHEPEDDFDGVWRLWVNEDFEYLITQGEAVPDGFCLLGTLKDLFKERQEKSAHWDLLLKLLE